jgi:FkbM family methyltransferase
MNLYDYKINENSIVFDVGGLHGNWSNVIIEKYNPYVYIFEPITEHYNKLVERFKDNIKVKIFKAGLFNEDCYKEINIDWDASGLYASGGRKELIELKKMSTILRENNISVVNLIEINIEGSEYPLLKDIISENIINKFENILIQYHRVYPDCVNERNKINSLIEKTHKQIFCKEFIWEGWSLI